MVHSHGMSTNFWIPLSPLSLAPSGNLSIAFGRLIADVISGWSHTRLCVLQIANGFATTLLLLFVYIRRIVSKLKMVSLNRELRLTSNVAISPNMRPDGGGSVLQPGAMVRGRDLVKYI